MQYPVNFHELAFGPDILEGLTGRIPPGLTGLVGANGAGKSVLLKLLAGKLQPIHGSVTWHVPFLHVDQFAADGFARLADALGVAELFDAFVRVEQGHPHEDDIERLADHWDKPAIWQSLLESAHLPTDLGLAVQTLSGGQQTRLMLCVAFSKPDHFLLLDEPGNHLDRRGRDWLIDKLVHHAAGALVVSHDRHLLRHVHQILELSRQGLQLYGGAYDFYQQQKSLMVDAVEQQVLDTEKQVRRLKQEQQLSQQRAARRRQQGERQRRDGSQGKILLDFKAEKAAGSQAREVARQQRSTQALSADLQAARSLRDSLRAQRLVAPVSGSKRGIVVHAEQLVLPFVQNKALINLTVHSGERWLISGANGTGKSTLLKVIAGSLKPIGGRCELRGSCLYLDQHFSFLQPDLSALDNLAAIDPQVSAELWRTWLGSLRLRADKALLPIRMLSGGERLKVALLSVSGRHHPPDLLLLDEPDNHLDLESLQMLEETLHDYQGTLMLVSHDPDFVQAVGVTHELALD
ncbi:ABC-F family ATP-binding cassette domain-containing protein [Pseudohongiella spirulinae]|uniref:ABC transporter, ATP-binding protein n=1 Tax=Pseudohongiella spirulinae TaxID=1249552 RepID=A0A0S2KGQ5_9GAMM|nr:ATP-binding cassette domain-containing protein [Pseudohongiella spirulinae]ALO47516.1 ABC transporter, ATP-binding protein [Pseudohongiella spirulinae]